MRRRVIALRPLTTAAIHARLRVGLRIRRQAIHNVDDQVVLFDGVEHPYRFAAELQRPGVADLPPALRVKRRRIEDQLVLLLPFGLYTARPQHPAATVLQPVVSDKTARRTGHQHIPIADLFHGISTRTLLLTAQLLIKSALVQLPAALPD